jgi:hypothetical protein
MGFFVQPMAIAPNGKASDRYSYSESFDFEW